MNIIEKPVDNNREIENIRAEAVKVDHLYLSDELYLVKPDHAKPGPSPSIFSRGDILSDVFENEEDEFNFSMPNIFIRGDFLVDVMENLDNASKTLLSQIFLNFLVGSQLHDSQLQSRI